MGDYSASEVISEILYRTQHILNCIYFVVVVVCVIFPNLVNF